MRVDILAALKQRGRQSRTILAKAALTICTAVMGSVAATPMKAQVQLPAVNLGDTNFEDGFAAPGLLLEEFPDVYSADILKDSKGATVPGTNTLTTISTTSHFAYISNKRLFGAWIGAEFVVPIVDVEVKLANGTNATVRGEADPVLGPFALQWAPKKVGPRRLCATRNTRLNSSNWQVQRSAPRQYREQFRDDQPILRLHV